MSNVSGNALWGSIKYCIEDEKLTDKQKLRRIGWALELYKHMNNNGERRM